MPKMVGQTLAGRYRVDEELGRGGMAEVYKVWDLERTVYLALKLLRKDLAQDRIFLRRFSREAGTLAKLQHPNIVRFYGLEQDERLAFFLMEFVEGIDLRTEIFDLRGKPMAASRMLEIVRPVCSALNFAHRQGFVHCDLKPANILVEKTGRVVVSDFGIARMTDAATATMLGFGTPAYMAPELVRGHEPTPQTDIYALGVVLFEMLTGGERPFTGEQAEITASTGDKVRWEQVNLDPPSPRNWSKGISGELEALVLRCLEKAASKRYDSVLEMYNALVAALPGEKAATPLEKLVQAKTAVEATLPKEEAKPKRLRPSREQEVVTRAVGKRLPSWIWVAGAGAIATVVVVIVGLSLGGGGPEPEPAPLVTATSIPATQALQPETAGTPTPPPGEAMRTHIVQPGDTLLGIARYYGVDMVLLMSINGMQSPDMLIVGQVIVIPSLDQQLPTATSLPATLIPGQEIVYVVLSGDTLQSIAAKFASTAGAIQERNGLSASGTIFVGMTLIIPTNVAAPSPTPNLGVGSTMVSPVDEMVLVYVPEGMFLMGSDEEDVEEAVQLCEQYVADCDRSSFEDEQPQHDVYLDAYWIDRTEVTNGMYAKCVAAGACDAPAHSGSFTRGSYYGDASFDDYPVIYVSWHQASAYCEWAGRRLPTEAEWEKAARGMEGQTYPWGDQPVSGELANYCDANCEFDWREASVDDGYEDTAPVGWYPAGASPYGALDMAGNVWEWVADWYDANYYDTSLRENPQGPGGGDYRALRGGSCHYDPEFLRAATRGERGPGYSDYGVGFRCGRSP